MNDFKKFFGLEWPRAAGAAFAGMSRKEANARARDLGLSITWHGEGVAPRIEAR